MPEKTVKIEAQFTKPTHTHKFDQTKSDAKYLASAATCTAKATYYYSCVCGAKGDKIDTDTGKDEQPKNGDITPYFVMGVATLVAMSAAVVYVDKKRKSAR